ncbi:MAG TPA: GNAT family N-acetyltransferase [Acidimicrobiia bacterium]|jgi:GNAT superfamily N-acetyltransferase
MTYTIREARPGDGEAIAAFTEDTFEWGDYVADAFGPWLDDPAGHLVVAADEADRAVATAFGTLVSDQEAWLQGARVHPAWRRRGIAGALDEVLESWARQRGASVARMVIEAWNTAAQAQVGSIGYRRVCSWVHAERSVGAASPVTAGNGGKRVAASEQLVRAHSSEAEPAYVSWSAGQLSRAGRGLIGIRWRFRRLTIDDLKSGARHDALWAARSGWVLGARHGEMFEVGWLETSEEDAADLARAIVDLAADQRAELLEVWAPDVGWLATALRRAGCELDQMSVWAKAL